MTTLNRTKKLARFKAAADKLEAMATELGFIGVTAASVKRDTSRSAITQLITRGRLEPVYVFGSPQLLLEDIDNFQRQPPGPKVEDNV